MKYKKSDITFDGRHFTFAPGIYKELKSDFYDKDVEEEIKKMERWLLANPPKKHWTRFVVGWLNRADKKLNFQERKKLDEKPQDRLSPRSSEQEPHRVDFEALLAKQKGVKNG